jgi:hypothetical protein
VEVQPGGITGTVRSGRGEGDQPFRRRPPPRDAARWQGVEEPAARQRPTRRRPAKDEAISADDGDRTLEPEDGGDLAARQRSTLPPAPSDDRADLLGPGVEPDPHPIRGDRRSAACQVGHGAERNEHPVGRDGLNRSQAGSGCRGDDHSAVEVGHADAADVERGPAAASHPIDRPAVDLDFADADFAATGEEAERHPSLERPATQRARDHRPAALHRECPIDRESCRTGRQAAGKDSIDERDERRPKLVKAGARRRRYDDDRSAGEASSVE